MLWLCGMLHAFTHIYQVALLPLYLRIQADFKLPNVGQATFLVTSMMIAYFLPSYLMGHLADHASRKKLLGWGLLINGLGFIGLSLAPNYSAAVLSMVVAGLGGSFFHPTATAMVARLYPVNTGKALGLLGVGASIGFFLGPLYAGWRAETAGWRAPVLELGIAGVAMAAFFFCFADPDHHQHTERDRPAEKMFPTASLWFVFLIACFAFSLRDFTGNGMGTLGSLFLQRAHGLGIKQTGFTLSMIFIASMISNPLFGRLSDHGRKRWTTFVLVTAAVVVVIFPHLPRSWFPAAYLVYGFFFMSSYPIIEAALMEAVPDSVRGRVFGCFITVGGLIGNLSHWLMGRWVEKLGPAASQIPSFYRMYALLALCILVCLLGLPCLHFIRRREGLEKSEPVPVPAT
jgi:FSR family fosmidomycin resistance protein-like MFS transporter